MNGDRDILGEDLDSIFLEMLAAIGENLEERR